MEVQCAKKFMRGLGLAACALALTSEAFGAAPEIRIEPLTLSFGAGATGAASAAGKAGPSLPARAPQKALWQALGEKAERAGNVRVIVRLSVPFTPEGRLANEQSVTSQRHAIDAAQDSALRKLEGTRATVHARFELIPFLGLEVDSEALKALASLPEVIGIEEDVAEPPALASSNPVIGSGVAWAHGLTGSGQVIAVLDTGVDKTHPFFAAGGSNKVVSEACYSSNTPDSTSVCPGGATQATAPGSGVNCPAEVEGCNHGTHVAGIAAGDDGVGPDFGVARGAEIVSIQVFSRFEDFCFGPCALSYVSDQVKALERVYLLAGELDVAAVNMSISGEVYFDRASCDAGNLSRKAAIDNLRSIDVATVIAAGNGGWWGAISAPACISSAVSVGATNDSDAVFGNFASFLDLLAPGSSINSSAPGGGLATFSGTSMATPHVAGAWAILRQANPSATVDGILTTLRATAVPVSVGGFSDLRRINLGRATGTGPVEVRHFTIHNDGSSVLSVLALELEQPVSWIRWFPEAPFDIPPGAFRQVTVSVDFGRAPDGQSLNRLLVESNDTDESPYPDGVFLVVDQQPCHLLTRSRAGSGSLPVPSLGNSSGCPSGRYHDGTVIQLAASPAAGWTLESWSGTDDDAGTSLTKSLTMPALNHTVAVTYTAPCNPLTRSHTGSGAAPVAEPVSSPGCPAGSYRYGERISLTAAPADGWRVGSWTGTEDDQSNELINTALLLEAPLAVTVTYLEGLPTVLLVDDGDNFSTLLSYYTDALNELGVVYEIWNIPSQGVPAAPDLAPYLKVVWVSGTNYPAGLSTTAEVAMGSYLDGGGCAFINDPEYLFYRGLTPFVRNYLGVTEFDDDVNHSRVTGRGSAFQGLGSYDLSYTSLSDHLVPAPGVEIAFDGTLGNAGVSKIGPSYRTIFLAFPFDSIPTPDARRDVMGAALNFCSQVFADVPQGYWARRWIEAVYRAGITSGCSTNPRMFCPEGLVTRDQMAVFLLLAKEGPGYVPPPCTTSPFIDISASSPFCPWIQELAERGITTGCGSGLFCPGFPVTRDQMSVFLLATEEEPGYVPPACGAASPFLDVPAASPFCPWVQEMVVRGVTSGCGPGLFCPSSPVTRAQMAVFLVTTFGLPLP